MAISLIFKYLNKYLTGKRVRQLLRQGLAIVGAFYFLNISYSFETVLNFRAIKVDSEKVIGFIAIYFGILGLFYPVLEFVLRLVFLKHLRKRFLKTSQKIKVENSFGTKRAISEIQGNVIDFVVDYPIQLGYVSSGEFQPLEVPETNITNKDKEEGINEVVGAFLRWSCTFIHLLVTLIVVYKYYPIIMGVFLLIGAVLAFFVVAVSVIAIDNVEIIMHVMLRQWNKKMKKEFNS